MTRWLLLLSCCVLWSVGCSKPTSSVAAPASVATAAPLPSGMVQIPADSPKLRELRVEPVRVADMPSSEFVAPGKVEGNPNRISRVVLPVPGRIAEVMVRFGDTVRKGQPLVAVESPEGSVAALAYTQAEAGITQAKANLAKAQNDFDRASDLFANDAVAQKEVLNAKTVLTQSTVALQQAEAEKAQAGGRLELLGLEPGQLRQRILVRAPLSGKVTEIAVVAGEFRNDTSAPLLTISDLSVVWISSDVPESQIRMVQVGERFDVTLTAFPEDIFRSRVARIADSVDPQNRTIKVWAEVANPKGSLRPEMFGQIRHVESSRKTPVVPAAAVMQEQGKSVVWRERGLGRFEPVEVTLGRRNGSLLPVTGLQEGDRIVVDGAMLLRGM